MRVALADIYPSAYLPSKQQQDWMWNLLKFARIPTTLSLDRASTLILINGTRLDINKPFQGRIISFFIDSVGNISSNYARAWNMDKDVMEYDDIIIGYVDWLIPMNFRKDSLFAFNSTPLSPYLQPNNNQHKLDMAFFSNKGESIEEFKNKSNKFFVERAYSKEDRDELFELASSAPSDICGLHELDAYIKDRASSSLKMVYQSAHHASNLIFAYWHVYERAVRHKIVRDIRDAGITLRAYGNGWENNYFGEKEMCEILSSVDSALHVNTLYGGYHPRLFETLFCGTKCYAYNPRLQEPITPEKWDDQKRIEILFNNSKYIESLVYSCSNVRELEQKHIQLTQDAMKCVSWFKNIEDLKNKIGEKNELR